MRSQRRGRKEEAHGRQDVQWWEQILKWTTLERSAPVCGRCICNGVGRQPLVRRLMLGASGKGRDVYATVKCLIEIPRSIPEA
jgi:hypothetical protein